MNTIETLFVLANTIGCAITCWYALCGLNACTRKTPTATRYSFALIAVGAFGALLHPPEMDIGGVGAIAVFLGVGIGFIANRKTCVCLNCPARPGKRKPEPREHHDGGVQA